MTDEIKALEKKMNAICDRMEELGNKCFVVEGMKITLKRSSDEWKEYQSLRSEMYMLADVVDKKKEEWLIENCDVVPVELIGMIRPIINGKTLYPRILIRCLWDKRVSYSENNIKYKK